MFRKFFLILLTVLILSPSSHLFADSVKSIAGISVTFPSAWQESQPTSSMRAFQFDIPGANGQKAELAAFYFGQGQGGDIEGNIHRWKGQFTEIANEVIETKNFNGVTVTQVLLEGTYRGGGPMMHPASAGGANTSVLGAIIQAPEGAVFLKITGPQDVVKNIRTDFDTMLASLQLS